MVLRKSKKLNSLNIFFILILLVGSILRLYFIFSKNVYPDEIFYTGVSRSSSFIALVSMTTWLKDHAILYLLFLKVAQFITLNITFLRLSNLFLYIVLGISLYVFFKKIKNGIVALVPVFLLSFLSYFVFLNVYISPYNFVVFFSILGFVFISNFILFSSTREEKLRNSILFLIFSTLAFYSDYSVIFFYLSLMPLVFLVFKWNERQAEDLTLLGFSNLLLIAPGLYQVGKNFHDFYKLNRVDYSHYNINIFLNNFSGSIFFYFIGGFSFLILFIWLVYLFFTYLKSKNKNIKFLSFFVLLGFITDLVFLYIFNNNYFLIFDDHIFWYFQFLLALGLSTLIFSLNKSKKNIILIALILFLFFKYFDIANGSTIFTKNIDYVNLVKQLQSNKSIGRRAKIIFWGGDYYPPLSDYYLKGYNLLDKTGENNLKAFMEDKKIVVLLGIRAVKYMKIQNKETLIFVFFNITDKDYQNFKNNLESHENSEGITATNIYYRLKCDNLNCVFYQAY